MPETLETPEQGKQTPETPDQQKRQPAAMDLKIRDIVRNAKYFAAVGAGNGADKSSPEFAAYRETMILTAIGAAIGSGILYRRKEAATDAPQGEQVKAFERDTRWIAAAAAEQLEIGKETPAYKKFADHLVDTALATAVANGRFKAPSRSFAEQVTQSREEGQAEGRGV